jgi:hypothetical protein
MRDVDLTTLPTSKAFFPTTDRGWFVHFWDISIGDVFIAIPFAILLTILFYFDHNGKSLLILITTKAWKRTKLTAQSLLPHSSRNRIPASQTSRIPLGYLPPGPHNRCCRSSWNPISKWTYPSSTIPHGVTLRNESSF